MFRARRLTFAVLTLTLSITAALTACGSSNPTAPASTAPAGKIIVGSFAFPESEILGEIYAQALKAKGLDVQTHFNVGPRQQTIPALRDGSINVIPEYNGNLLAFYDPKYTQRTTADVDAALVDKVKADKLQILKSAAAEDKDAYVVKKKTAEDKGLTSIGDLAKIVPFKLGSNPQFGTLGYGIPGLKGVYGVAKNAKEVTFVPIEDFGGPDTVKALVDDSVQVADIYTTSPALTTENLVVLKDPKNMISSQNVVPLVADSVRTDKLVEALNNVSAQLTTADLIALRNRVEGKEKASASSAAKDWLTKKGLI
jgi:osmoprotectant transport system substrate-binding protein